tara:strand:- start:2051 stop:4084 length:2034 start_codon:yes stop_codon:yes gene_type:complete
MTVRCKNRGLIYLRKSSAPQETSLEKQLTWALDATAQEGVAVDACLADMLHMQAHGLHSYKSIRLDDAITGSDLRRPGLVALVEDATNDTSISYIFVYKRNRLGRPDSPVDMMAIEDSLLRQGITIVRSDGTAKPLPGGEAGIDELVKMLVEYWMSGRDLRELSEQMIRTQTQLAQKGYWAGGNAPYGFARALVNQQGDVLEILPKGKKVRQAGCHIVLVPDDEKKIGIWIDILRLKEQGMSYKKIAQHLNEQKIPSPAAGTMRTDHRIRHKVSGKWTHTTVRSLCLNRTIMGILDYGRRSEGKFRRFSPDGPRLLAESDRKADGTNKRIFNDPSLVVSAPLLHEAKFELDRWEKIQEQIRERGKSQQGLSKPRDPARYPLACRVIDLTEGCGSVMYARTSGKRRQYVCGRYMTSNGVECHHNNVDAEAMLRFTLGTLTELIDRFGAHGKLKQKLMERAARDESGDSSRMSLVDDESILRHQATELEQQLAAARRNLAIEEIPELREAIRGEYQRINHELESTCKQLETIQFQRTKLEVAGRSPEQEVKAALNLLEQIRHITENDSARAAIPPILERLGLRIGLNFVEATKGKKRRVRRLAGGFITFGDTLRPGDPAPRCGGDGPTNSETPKQNTKKPKNKSKAAPIDHVRSIEAADSMKCHGEGISFTKGSRDDKI